MKGARHSRLFCWCHLLGCRYVLSSYTLLWAHRKLLIKLAMSFLPRTAIQSFFPLQSCKKSLKYECMTLHLFVVIIYHSSWPVQENLNFDFVTYSPHIGSGFQKDSGFSQKASNLRTMWELAASRAWVSFTWLPSPLVTSYSIWK